MTWARAGEAAPETAVDTIQGRATTPRVLVADDERDIATVIELALSNEGYSVEVVHDGTAAIERALKIRPDVVILDVMMPGRTGIEVCRELRGNPLTASAGIVLLTALDGTLDRVLGFEAGADDYLVKPFHPLELRARVAAALRRADQLRSMSPLTGLPGNFDIVRELGRLVDEPGASFALIHADLDSFKAYNDRYGFVRGDAAIVLTAEVLLGAMEEFHTHPSFLGHVGGDDFALIVSPESAEAICELAVLRFDRAVPDLYDPDDRARGHVEIADRRGVIQRFPLLTISMGVASTLSRRLTSPAEASEIATELKQLAKKDQGSSWRIDRRRA